MSDSLQPHGIVHGILLARILGWVPFPSSGDLPDPGLLHCRRILYQLSHQGSPNIMGKKKIIVHVLSHLSSVQLFATPWTVACQAPLSMGFSRHEYWSGFPFPSPRDLPDPGIEPASPTSLLLAGGFFTTSTTWEAWH